MIISDYRWNPILYGPSTLRHHGRLYAPSCVPALLLPVGSLAQVRYNLVTRTAVLPILPGGPLLVLVPDGDLLDTSNQRTFLGEATTQGRCIAFRPFASPRGSLLNSSQRRANRYSPQTVARAPPTESTAIIQKSIDSMHLLLSLAVGYIQIVTHGRVACNCVVASHT